MKLEDGTGSGFLLRINAENRANVSAITEAESDHEAENGNKFNLNTSDITLTTANESAVFYYKNTGDHDFVATLLAFLLGNSTGGTGDWVVDVIRNPSAGTVVSDETIVPINSNFNFGSNKTLSGISYKGDEGKTLTDGSVHTSSRLSGGGRVGLSLGALHIPKGSSIGIKITPQASNTSVKVQVAMVGYEKVSAS